MALYGPNMAQNDPFWAIFGVHFGTPFLGLFPPTFWLPVRNGPGGVQKGVPKWTQNGSFLTPWGRPRGPGPTLRISLSNQKDALLVSGRPPGARNDPILGPWGPLFWHFFDFDRVPVRRTPWEALQGPSPRGPGGHIWAILALNP